MNRSITKNLESASPVKGLQRILGIGPREARDSVDLGIRRVAAFSLGVDGSPTVMPVSLNISLRC